jgi:hypothetical protein
VVLHPSGEETARAFIPCQFTGSVENSDAVHREAENMRIS